MTTETETPPPVKTPTVGDTVLYHTPDHLKGTGTQQLEAAMVTGVNDAGNLNLHVFHQSAAPTFVDNVPAVTDPENTVGCWFPRDA